MANFVISSHRRYVDMCASLYKAARDVQLGEYSLVHQVNRFGVYQGPYEIVIVVRGTQDRNDVLDDLFVAGVFNGETSLYQEVKDFITQKYLNNLQSLTMTGHSLGGYVALKIANQFGLKSVVFNAAAPPTKPTDFGTKTSVAYHIVGDLVSSHINDNNATVFRIDIGVGFDQTIFAHGLQRFKEPIGKRLITSVEEQTLFREFERKIKLGSLVLRGALVPLAGFIVPDPITRQIQRIPIAGNLLKINYSKYIPRKKR